MKTRFITITIDSVMALLRDYMPEGDIPEDAKPVKLFMNPTERGKMAIEFVSDELSSNDLAPLEARFQMKRYWAAA